MKLEIISPEGTVFSSDVASVLFPGQEGKFMVLPNHAPLVAILSEGEICVDHNGEMKYFAIHGGLVEVDQSSVNVCVD